MVPEWCPNSLSIHPGFSRPLLAPLPSPATPTAPPPLSPLLTPFHGVPRPYPHAALLPLSPLPPSSPLRIPMPLTHAPTGICNTTAPFLPFAVMALVLQSKKYFLQTVTCKRHPTSTPRPAQWLHCYMRPSCSASLASPLSGALTGGPGMILLRFVPLACSRWPPSPLANQLKSFAFPSANQFGSPCPRGVDQAGGRGR